MQFKRGDRVLEKSRPVPGVKSTTGRALGGVDRGRSIGGRFGGNTSTNSAE